MHVLIWESQNLKGKFSVLFRLAHYCLKVCFPQMLGFSCTNTLATSIKKLQNVTFKIFRKDWLLSINVNTNITRQL